MYKKLIMCTFFKNLQMGAAGFRGSWSPVFPDNGGLLFNMRDLQLSNQKQITFNQGIS